MKLEKYEIKQSEELSEIVMKLIYNFELQYGVRPRFIKMPDTVFEELKRQFNHFGTLPQYYSSYPYYMGLLICDTREIKSINDIEVF